MKLQSVFQGIVNSFCGIVFCILVVMFGNVCIGSMAADTFTDGSHTAKLKVHQSEGAASYTLTTTAPLRDNEPTDKMRTFTENPDFPSIRTGNEMFDALYALTLDDARLSLIKLPIVLTGRLALSR